MRRLVDSRGRLASRSARIAFALSALCIACTALLLSLGSASAATTSQTFVASADARVSSAAPANNYGASTTLKADGCQSSGATSASTSRA